MLQLPAQAHLLPHLPRSPRLHQKPCHGEGGQLCTFSLQVCLVGMRSHTASHRQDRTRRAVRVPAVLMPLPRRLLQVAGLPGCCNASPDASAQIHHHIAGQILPPSDLLDRSFLILCKVENQIQATSNHTCWLQHSHSNFVLHCLCNFSNCQKGETEAPQTVLNEKFLSPLFGT